MQRGFGPEHKGIGAMMDMSIQGLIDSGMAWRMEGSIGRQCMAAIEAGHVMLGPEGHYDYYGNYVPSRFEVEPGTMGSEEYMLKHDDDDPIPTCDYCDEQWEDGGEGEDWNGDTGCHYSCEAEAKGK